MLLRFRNFGPVSVGFGRKNAVSVVMSRNNFSDKQLDFLAISK